MLTAQLAINVDLHTDTNNFAPNEYREVVIPSGLVVHKGLNASDSSDRYNCNSK